MATPVLTILVILTLLPFAASALSPSRGPVAGTLGSAPSGAVSFSVSPSLSPHLVIEVLASDSAEVNNVLSLAPHLRAGDYIDLYEYSSCCAVNVAHVDQIASELRAAVPSGVVIDAGTGLAKNVQKLAAPRPNAVQGIAATYEPIGATAPGTYTFAACLKYFAQVNQIDHAAGLTSIAYPTGHPLLTSSLQSYGWNYGDIAQVTDLVWIETQEYARLAVNDSSVWTSALTKLISQFQGAGEPLSKLAVQVTLGNDNHGTGTDPAVALTAIQTAAAMGIQNIYLWTAQGAESGLGTLITSLDRNPAPPPSYPVSGVVHSGNGSAIVGAQVIANSSGNASVAVTNQTGGFTFTLPNGTYHVTAVAPGYGPSDEANVTVTGAPVAGELLVLSPWTYPVSGEVDSPSGSMLAGALVFANSSGASMQAATNVSGGFMFHLPNGMYEMSATAFGYAPAPTANVTVAGAPVVGLTLTLSTLNYTVLGVVTNASSGSPIANATVVVALAGPPLLARTSSTGQFVLNLAAGRYGVQVSAFVYQSINGTLVVGPNNLSASYALVPAPEFILNGTITVPEVNGSAGGTTLLMATPNGTLEFDVTNSSFTLHVPNGTYQLVALSPDFAPVILRVVVEGNHVETIPIVFSSIIPVPPRTATRSAPLPYFQVGAGALEVSAAIAWLLFGPVPWRRRPPGTIGRRQG